MLRVAYWASLLVLVLNAGLGLFILLGTSDYRRPWWVHLVAFVAALALVTFAIVPGWWERIRPPRENRQDATMR